MFQYSLTGKDGSGSSGKRFRRFRFRFRFRLHASGFRLEGGSLQLSKLHIATTQLLVFAFWVPLSESHRKRRYKATNQGGSTREVSEYDFVYGSKL